MNELSTPVNLLLAQEIEKRRRAFYEPKTALYPRRAHYPSDLSSCARQMVYNRVDWDKREPFSVELYQRFDAGNGVEERIKKELTNLGFELAASGITMSRSSKMERYGISGRLDTIMKFNDKHVLVEIKSMHPMSWKKTTSLEDFEKNVFLRKYLRQMQIYLLGFEIELGLFILDDCLGHWKMLPVYLDYDYAESILKVIEKANFHIKTWEGGVEGILPDRIPYGEECRICPFAGICLPGMENEPAEIIDSVEWESKLKRFLEVKAFAKEAKDLREEIAVVFEKRPKSIIGNVLVVSKEHESVRYRIPEEIKSQYQHKEKTYRISVQDLDAAPAVEPT